MTSVSRAEWRVWSCDVSVVVTSPGDVAAAAQIARDVIASVDKACSRFREDSELAERRQDLVRGADVTPLLAELMSAALLAASWTDGDVDPTLGSDLEALGYDRDISRLYTGPELEFAPPAVSIARREAGWSRITLDGVHLTVPSGLVIDLGATAKAFTADRAAALIVESLGGGVLVSIGGDIATAGSSPDGGWNVLVQDTQADPSQLVALAAGAAIATSSTQKRRWMSGGYARHHILDPRVGLPAARVWRSATVSANSCLRANALSTASIVRGLRAPEWLNGLGESARMVDQQGRVVLTGGWPSPQAQPIELELAR